ncbi:MAG: hypothetical protein MR272_01940 [Pseudoflavonifractor sp.]|nr:hypothetical protein [Pseudoflavonifractor sp.]
MNETNETPILDDDLDAAWADETPEAQEPEPPQAHPVTEAPQAEEPPAAPEEQEEKPAEADQPELFTLKNRDETRQVTREELVSMAQKGWDYDTVRQERDQLRQYREEADPALLMVRGYAERSGMTVEQYLDLCRRQELLSQGVNEQTADAQIRLEKQQTILEAQTRAAQEARQRQEAEAQKAQEAQAARRKDMEDFMAAHPGVKGADIPNEVWAQVAAGKSMTTAYTEYENKQLKAELAAERQNKANAQRSPGSLTNPQGEDTRSELDKIWYSDDD